MDWHKRLTLAREAAGIKKTAFAKMAGVSAPSVTDWENGKTKMIDGANLVRVCYLLGITPQWLIDGAVPPAPNPTLGGFQERDPELMWVQSDEFFVLDHYRSADEDGKKLLRVVASGLSTR